MCYGTVEPDRDGQARTLVRLPALTRRSRASNRLQSARMGSYRQQVPHRPGSAARATVEDLAIDRTSGQVTKHAHETPTDQALAGIIARSLARLHLQRGIVCGLPPGPTMSAGDKLVRCLG